MWWLLFILVLLLLAFEVPRARLRYVLSQAFPLPYSKILRKNLPEYSKMPTDLQMQLKRRIRQFLFQKTFVGCGGLIITDEIKVTIAGRACMLLLNRSSEVYPKLTHILVYPSAFVAPRTQMLNGGVVTHTNQGLSGESWSDGRVILAWDQIIHHPANIGHGQDVVMHEFAHQLDSESGSTNGAPLLPDAEAYRRWSQVMEVEYTKLLHAREHHHATVIDPYGATNPAEFFAVTTEAFFKKSTELAVHHPALYEQLRSYYQVEPRDWS
ncbi:zinc-dependent peptidase [Undibacterium sp. Dicai25W]|uniref:M90 family metallopeptidase n=1 Tax=Undibacterium sp. Dicai25W TaxID=3413034 RepID=UPI003BEF769A